MILFFCVFFLSFSSSRFFSVCSLQFVSCSQIIYSLLLLDSICVCFCNALCHCLFLTYALHSHYPQYSLVVCITLMRWLYSVSPDWTIILGTVYSIFVCVCVYALCAFISLVLAGFVDVVFVVVIVAVVVVVVHRCRRRYFFPFKYFFSSLYLFSFCFADCVLYAVGKPVYHKSTDVTYGSWLKDSNPRTKEFSEKIWTTYETDRTIIYEFADKTSFRNNQAKELRLKSPGFQVCCSNFFLFYFVTHSLDCISIFVGYQIFLFFFTDFCSCFHIPTADKIPFNLFHVNFCCYLLFAFDFRYSGKRTRRV